MSGNHADLLRQHGLQVTAQRLAVLRAVSERPHGTADDVANAARAGIGVVSRQAVYDALGVLAENGRRCGRMDDVDCAVGAAPCLAAADDSGYEIDEAEVTYWGVCPDCREAPHTGRAQP